MKLLKFFVAFAIVSIVSICWSEDTGFIVGEGWVQSSNVDKHMYVRGVAEASNDVVMSNAVANAVKEHKATSAAEVLKPNQYFPQGVLVETMVEALDKFYTEPANRPIAVIDAMKILTAKFKGDSEACTSARIATERAARTDERKNLRVAVDREMEACGK